MNNTEKDESFQVVGWGLAGCVMTWQLYFLKKRIVVFDSGVNHATRVAAGLVNPVVFRRLTKSWNADVLLPAADHFYSKIENELGVQLLSRKSIYRVFSSVEEQNNWSSKEGDDRFTQYLKTPDQKEYPDSECVDFPYGIGKVETIGNLDTNLFLDKSKTFLQKQGVTFVNDHFDYKTVDQSECYIFCEGVGMEYNPFFNDLPLRQTHGETLKIKTDRFKFEHVLNKNMFMLALGEGEFKVGATYNWDLKEPVITDKGREELEEKMQTFLKFDYRISDHKAGIRPTVSDRRPLIGRHPKSKNLYVFNGLGTKGVMLAPYYAHQFAVFITEGGTLDPEVDIRRFQNR